MRRAKLNHKKLKIISSARLWLILGTVFILVGFMLAHLSNANMIHWSYGLENIAHIIFHVIGPIFLLFGIIMALIEKFRK